MSINAYIVNAQTTLDRSARLDISTANDKLGKAESDSNIRLADEIKLEATLKDQQVRLAKIDEDRDCLDDIANFFDIDDQGEADLTKDVGLTGAALDRTANRSSLIKGEMKDATQRLADGVKHGQQAGQRTEETLDFRAELRQNPEG